MWESEAPSSRAGVSRTFLYENPAARELVSEIIDHTTTHDPVDGCRDTTPDTTWRERALNAEDALKAAHIEIHGQRTRIAQLMGQIRDMETRWTDESISHITTENTNLKQRLRQLTQDNRAIDERLQAARSNSRFQDRRIAQLEAHLLEPGRLR